MCSSKNTFDELRVGSSQPPSPITLWHPQWRKHQKLDILFVRVSPISISFPPYRTCFAHRRIVIERAITRRSALFAREEPKVSSLWCDRAKLKLVEDPVLVFALDEFPIAVRTRPSYFLCVITTIAIGLTFKRSFFRRVPAPKTILIQVHPMSRGCDARDAHELLVACQNDLRRTAGFERCKTDAIQFEGSTENNQRSRTEEGRNRGDNHT